MWLWKIQQSSSEGAVGFSDRAPLDRRQVLTGTPHGLREDGILLLAICIYMND